MNLSALIAEAVRQLPNMRMLEILTIPGNHFSLFTFLTVFQEINHAPYG